MVFVIHMVGSIYWGRGDEFALLAVCYENSLNFVFLWNLCSIVFLFISIGVYCYLFAEVVLVAVRVVFDWVECYLDVF